MYIVIKRDLDGKVYEVKIASDSALIAHLRATFLTTNHDLVAVIKL